MKTLFILVTSVLSVALFTSERRATIDSPGGLKAKEVDERVTQEPAPPQEWDPARQGIGDLTERPRTEVAPQNRRPIAIVGRRFTPMEFASYVKSTVGPELRQRGHW